MSLRADSIRVMHPLFHSGEGGSTPTSALSLRFHECQLADAISLNRLWHSRLPKVVASNITRNARWACYGAEAENGLTYAVAIWSSPSAMGLPYHEWLELRRMAIADDAPKNTASRMLAWMTRDIRKRFPEIVRLISYQDCDVHTGTIYKAAGWTATVKSMDHRNRGLRSGRKRNMSQTTSTKQRWEKGIMTRPDFANVMAYIAAALQKPVSAESVEVYFDLLHDLPLPVLQLAAKRVVLQHKWATFPSVAELREAAAETMAGVVKDLSPAEAWALAWKAACRIDPEQDGSVERACKGLPLLVCEAMRSFGVNALVYGREPIGVVRGQWMKIYEQLQARTQRERLLPAALKEQVAAIGAEARQQLRGIGVERTG